MPQEARFEQQRLEVEQILEKATTAVEKKDWFKVSQYLQQLPIEQNNTDQPVLEENQWEQILHLALQVLRESDFQQRWEIVKFLPKLKERAIAPSIEILNSEEVELEIRWFVGRMLAQFDDPAIVISLVNLLKNTEDEELSLMASQALASIGTSAVEALSALLLQEDYRLLAVQALGQIRQPKIIEPLLSVVNDPSPQVRATAIEALGSFHDPRIPTVLVNALTDLSAVVRKEAVSALGMRRDLNAQLDLVNKLKVLLYDLNPEVCRYAAIALGRMKNNEAAEVLFAVLHSSATPVGLKIEVVRALSWIETVLALDYLQEALSWEKLEVSQEIVTVLGRFVLPDLKVRATEILIDFLNSGKAAIGQIRIKQALAMSLGQLGETQAIKPLQELAIDSEETVRLHAIAALRKLGVG